MISWSLWEEAIFNHHQNLLQDSRRLYSCSQWRKLHHRLILPLLHGGLLIWKLLHRRLRRSLLGLALDLFSIYLHSVLLVSSHKRHMHFDKSWWFRFRKCLIFFKAVVSPAQTRNLFADIASSRSRPTCQRSYYPFFFFPFPQRSRLDWYWSSVIFNESRCDS